MITQTLMRLQLHRRGVYAEHKRAEVTRVSTTWWANRGALKRIVTVSRSLRSNSLIAQLQDTNRLLKFVASCRVLVALDWVPVYRYRSSDRPDGKLMASSKPAPRADSLQPIGVTDGHTMSVKNRKTYTALDLDLRIIEDAIV